MDMRSATLLGEGDGRDRGHELIVRQLSMNAAAYLSAILRLGSSLFCVCRRLYHSGVPTSSHGRKQRARRRSVIRSCRGDGAAFVRILATSLVVLLHNRNMLVRVRIIDHIARGTLRSLGMRPTTRVAPRISLVCIPHGGP